MTFPSTLFESRFNAKITMKRGLKIENRLGLKINSRHVKRKREKENKKSNDFIVKLLGNFALQNLSTVLLSI